MQRVKNRNIREKKFGIVIPAANEAESIEAFAHDLIRTVKKLQIHAIIFFVIDKASTDNTRPLLEKIAKKHPTLHVIFEPKNTSVVDAYVRGFREALKKNCDFIIEMDCGFSHLPQELALFVTGFAEGFDCVFGVRQLWSRNYQVPFHRRVYSLGGTVISNLLLGTHFTDMTSGYEGFTRNALKEIIKEPLLSVGHFYQTEIRYRARNFRYKEVPITYSSPSPRVKWKYIKNALATLFYLSGKQWGFRK